MSEMESTDIVEDVVVDEVSTDENLDNDAEENLEENTDEISDESSDEDSESTDEEALEEAKEELKSTIKKLNLKVDGEEIEREIDLADEDELIKLMQLAEMGNKRAQEASDLRKADMTREAQLEEFMNVLRTNPELILQDMGVDVNAFAEEMLTREVEKMKMSPEELELMELREEVKRIKESEEAAKNLAKQREEESLRDRFAADLEKNLIESIEEYGLPNSPHIVNELIHMVSVAHKQGIELEFSDVAPLVKEQYETDVRSRINGLSADDLVSILSEDKISNIVAKHIPETKAPVPSGLNEIKEGGEKKSDTETPRFRKESLNDFFNNRRLKGD